MYPRSRRETAVELTAAAAVAGFYMHWVFWYHYTAAAAAAEPDGTEGLRISDVAVGMPKKDRDPAPPGQSPYGNVASACFCCHRTDRLFVREPAL
jgi:hypothetical protein